MRIWIGEWFQALTWILMRGFQIIGGVKLTCGVYVAAVCKRHAQSLGMADTIRRHGDLNSEWVRFGVGRMAKERRSISRCPDIPMAS
jgi:hypothetical protein